MNRWLLIHRLRWPAFVILFGITALLNQWGVLSFGRSWPLYLILAGLLWLAERAALSDAVPPQFPPVASPAHHQAEQSETANGSAPPRQPPLAGDPGAGEQPLGGNGRA